MTAPDATTHPYMDIASDNSAIVAPARHDIPGAGADTAGGGWPSSPFACVDTAFAALTTGPAPLTVDGDRFDPVLGLPAGPVTLPVLRDWLRPSDGVAGPGRGVA